MERFQSTKTIEEYKQIKKCKYYESSNSMDASGHKR